MKNAIMFCAVILFASCGDEINLVVNDIAGPTSAAAEVIADRIDVIPPFVEAINGQTFTLTAKVFAGGIPLEATTVTWASSSPAVANILETMGGTVRIKAEGPGTADITASVGQAQGRCTVRVNKAN